MNERQQPHIIDVIFVLALFGAFAFSAVMLILAVSSLLFAVHPAISSIGLSTLAGMISTIVITFTLQPYLFYKWEAFRHR